MRCNWRWILTVLRAAILFSGGYAMMAWTAPVLYRTSRGARPGVELAGSDGTYAQSEQPAVCAGAAGAGGGGDPAPRPAQSCGHIFSHNPPRSQRPPSLVPRVAAPSPLGGGIEPADRLGRIGCRENSI